MSSSGIGLSIVKAIMDSMHQQCGVINHEDGVEFWIELDTSNRDDNEEECEITIVCSSCSVNSIGCSPHPPNNNAANSTHAVVFIFLSLIGTP